ncbi:MAG: hypothetical protein KUG83_06765 [Gammaproteobacteria bacterium]|nr:hypothetical protein [Gammaproteobacteria bacterium]
MTKKMGLMCSVALLCTASISQAQVTPVSDSVLRETSGQYNYVTTTLNTIEMASEKGATVGGFIGEVTGGAIGGYALGTAGSIVGGTAGGIAGGASGLVVASVPLAVVGTVTGSITGRVAGMVVGGTTGKFVGRKAGSFVGHYAGATAGVTLSTLAAPVFIVHDAIQARPAKRLSH